MSLLTVKSGFIDAVAIKRVHNLEFLCVVCWSHAGHLSDPDDFPGLAHFCEHMLFLGTEKVMIK